MECGRPKILYGCTSKQDPDPVVGFACPLPDHKTPPGLGGDRTAVTSIWLAASVDGTAGCGGSVSFADEDMTKCDDLVQPQPTPKVAPFDHNMLHTFP